MLLLLTACSPSRPPPVISTTERWQAVEELARTSCGEWPEDDFPTDLGPADRRAALRAWHAADPDAVTDVDARYATFAYVDRADGEDLPVIAHLVASLRACGRWVDQRTEEELVLRACAVDPRATADALAGLAPGPSAQVRAARESVWVVEMEAPSVEGRFTAMLLLGAKEWMAKWVLDGQGVLPEIPVNLPFAQLLREETRAAEPGIPEMVARCTTAAPAGGFLVPAAESAGVIRAGADGVPTLWWPEAGVLGAEPGPLGPVGWWVGSERRGVVEVGPARLVPHCPGTGAAHWEAPVPLGDAPAAGGSGELGIALPPHATTNPWTLGTDACGPVLTGPGGTWSLGCCAGR